MINQKLDKLFYMDIETCPMVEDFMSLPERLADLWIKKHADKMGEMPEYGKYWNDHAGLEAEFSKVVCISFGTFSEEAHPGLEVPNKVFRVKSICSTDEGALLAEFAHTIEKAKGHSLAGHNILGFDIPFLAKRFVINGMAVPRKLNKIGVKPWEDTDVDTMQLWRNGNFNAKFTSLDLLSAVLGIQSPKSDMTGASVRDSFYKGEYDRIKDYCQEDVICSARVCQRLNLEVPISDDKIRYV